MLRWLDWPSIIFVGIVLVPYIMYHTGKKNSIRYLKKVLRINRRIYDFIEDVVLVYMRRRANETKAEIELLREKEKTQ